MPIDNELVRRYKQAYKALHGSPFLDRFEYSYGWYRWRRGGFVCRCFRRADLLRWAENLERRAREGDR
jgi:hypothetical protein